MVTAELLHKYDVPAPRYTSYPSVPYWHAVDEGRVRDWLQEPPSPHASLSLYVHIPFCRARCHYCACNVIISPEPKHAEPYVEAVLAEMREVRARMHSPLPVRQFHLGGGTPTYLSPALLGRLVEGARHHFPFEPNLEMSIEVDPRTVTVGELKQLRAMGFNRLSLGIQDFDERVQHAVNRVQPYDEVARLVEGAWGLGFYSINFDLIYGLPEQTRASFAHTLRRVYSLRPERLAVYNFAHLPDSLPHQRRISADRLPGPDEKVAMFLDARQQLLEWDYTAIGLDHFALPEDDLTTAFREGTLRRNFMGYTTQAGTDVLAFGVSAISDFGDHYWQNEKKLAPYYRTVHGGHLPVQRGLALNADDRLRKAIISGLFCAAGVDLRALGRAHGVETPAHLAQELKALQPMIADGLVTVDDGVIRVTAEGQLFLRNIAMVFDARLRASEAEPVRFSRAV